MIFSILVAVITGYFLGSFPTAYVLLKRKGLDITEEGSGNVGALNASRVGSKTLGFLVFFIDALKGALAVKLAMYFSGGTFLIGGAALFAAIAGHCYSVFIKFKGGRGLATALGGSLLIAPQIAVLWIILWAIAYLYKKNVHFSNAAATFLLILLVIFSGEIIVKYSLVKADSVYEFSALVSAILFVILTKHFKPVIEYFTAQRNTER